MKAFVLRSLSCALLIFGVANSVQAQTGDHNSGSVMDSSVMINQSTGKLSESITFNKGSSELTAADQLKLRGFIDSARAGGKKIGRIHVAAWSDKDFPQFADLPKGDRDLAKARAERIERYLKDRLDVTFVSSYYMAERSNWLARAFATKDAELKTLFGQKGSAPLTHDEFRLVKDAGAPMKAVVVVSVEVPSSNP